MRTFPLTAAFARGFLSTTLLIGFAALAPAHAFETEIIADPTPVGVIPAPGTKPGTFKELRAVLSDDDRQVALSALHIALNQLSDGAAFVWRSKARSLTGVIRPTMAFRDDEGRVCRHIVYTVALGRFQKHVEGIACRGLNGGWILTN